LSQYFLHQLKPASTKAVVPRYNPGPALSIASNVLQLALNDRGILVEVLYLYRVCRVELSQGVKEPFEAIRCVTVKVSLVPTVLQSRTSKLDKFG
jgi:uroporphyrinogen-III synthase